MSAFRACRCSSGHDPGHARHDAFAAGGGFGGGGNSPPQVPSTLPRPPDAGDDVNYDPDYA
jgi:hypothetical protein